ncbi:efflux transporter outer membrane subunit [Neisseria zalophi]|uniref:TolC family protein n=1 Tax=Neisseria zalophi TaxID=640030 RepID=A0A5J6PYT3_9NEIS|nr:TolC family protein [Neisseria zalophi]QEY26313.1 TolC family protein [Neisseria zalophi]
MNIRFPSFPVALLVSLITAACQSHTIPLDSKVDLPTAFNQAQAAQGSEDIRHWWQYWHDPVLNKLIEQGLQKNFDIQTARSRLNEARANARLAGADKGPTAILSTDARHLEGRIGNPLNDTVRNNLRAFPQAAPLTADHFRLDGNSLSGGWSVSWEPDIFGRKSSDADAALAAAMGAQEQVYGAQLLVAGDIADNYFKARAAEQQMRTAKRSTDTLARLVRYVKGRFQAGHLTAYEVGEAESRLSALQAKYSTLQAQRDVYVRNIAVLTGQAPQTFRLPDSSADILASVPAAPAGQTPQGLLERRPDIRARAAQVNAYAAKLASAKADLLPRFSIDFLGQGSISVDSDSGVRGWGSLLKAGISVPIFTNGRIRANIAAADARLQTALLEYDQNILKALGEVDSSYQTYYALNRQSTLLTTAHQQAAKQADDAEKLFKYGNQTLDKTLTARLEEQQRQEDLIQSQLARAQILVSLYKALGGGWTVE